VTPQIPILKGHQTKCQQNSTEDEFTDIEDIADIDDEYSEISGDCDESQPCRGDEPWLDQELDP
jgi:hypothetical protein